MLLELVWGKKEVMVCEIMERRKKTTEGIETWKLDLKPSSRSS